MNYRIIDMNTYPRRAHFEYFSSLHNPYVGTTVQVDITEFHDAVKGRGLPFFLSFLYCVSHAANAIAPLRQRIIDGRIVEYEFCRTSHTVALDDGTYCYCNLNANMSFDEYIPRAQNAQTMAKMSPTIDDGRDCFDMIYISCVKDLIYTSLVQPTPYPADTNPRVTWGKFFRQGESVRMPVTVLANHALVDGGHISLFYEKLSAELENLTHYN
ncbi:MAG: CatA-like O-acetyltransferase [Clostridia bacterium]|nr:CatA-like O-acetyltransferase [Clostridia bacterium]